MGLGYAVNVLRRFHGGDSEPLARRALALTRDISLDTARFLDKAIALAERVDLGDFDAIERETALLGLEIAAADRRFHEELDALHADLRAFAAGPAARASLPRRPTASFHNLKASLALGLSMAVALGGCDGCGKVETTGQGGQGGHGGLGTGGTMVVDPPPPDGGTGGWVVDPAPEDAGTGGSGGSGGGMIVDPPPPDAGMGALDVGSDGRVVDLARDPRKLRLIDQWSDTSPKSTVRTVDLPLFDPPRLKLVARREGDDVVVSLHGAFMPVTTRWEADGEIDGAGLEVRWRPQGPADRVRVAIRSRGGVAVLSLRPEEVAASTV